LWRSVFYMCLCCGGYVESRAGIFCCTACEEEFVEFLRTGGETDSVRQGSVQFAEIRVQPSPYLSDPEYTGKERVE